MGETYRPQLLAAEQQLQAPGHDTADETALSWQEAAVCKDNDPEIFFPLKGNDGGAVKAAKQICAQCIVQPQCLKYALSNNERFGVWGGATERERRRIQKSESGVGSQSQSAEDVPVNQ